MHLLYCDESNLDARKDEFFVYAGICIPAKNALALSNQIQALREGAGIDNNFHLKFNPAPDQITHEQFVNVKKGIVELAIQHGCKAFTSIILHAITTSPDDARRNEINRILYHFNSHLGSVDSTGLVLVDRFDDSQIDAHLREKFCLGLTGMPYAGNLRLDKIVGYHYSAIGQSNFTSLIDVVAGSLRWSINAFTRGDAIRLESAKKILQALSPLFMRTSSGAVQETEFFFSPKVIKSPQYRERYIALKGFLQDCGIPVSQEITGERNY